VYAGGGGERWPVEQAQLIEWLFVWGLDYCGSLISGVPRETERKTGLPIDKLQIFREMTQLKRIKRKHVNWTIGNPALSFLISSVEISLRSSIKRHKKSRYKTCKIKLGKIKIYRLTWSTKISQLIERISSFSNKSLEYKERLKFNSRRESFKNGINQVGKWWNQPN